MAPTPDTMNETIKLHRASAIIVDRRPESPIERPPLRNKTKQAETGPRDRRGPIAGPCRPLTSRTIPAPRQCGGRDEPGRGWTGQSEKNTIKMFFGPKLLTPGIRYKGKRESISWAFRRFITATCCCNTTDSLWRPAALPGFDPASNLRRPSPAPGAPTRRGRGGT